MILILSQAEFETSTEEVMDWLDGLGATFFRLNGQDLEDGGPIRLEICGGRTEFRIKIDDEKCVPLSNTDAVWFRRWAGERRHEKIDLIASSQTRGEKLSYDVKRQLTFEARSLSRFFFSSLSSLPWLSDPDTAGLNKLHALELAAKEGLRTPATLVTNRRREVQEFFASHGPLITKPIGEVATLLEGERVHFMYTSHLDKPTVDALPEHFAPSLFQECIEKKFELRVFYLDRECHPMAIFSQSDPDTKLDFRRHSVERPNRYVPYRLTPQTAGRIENLMDRLGLETGSLDFIRTLDGDDVFLEINPIGQFGMVSKPCNYQLERKIAESLIRRTENRCER